MKVAIVSDIHGNLMAFEKFIKLISEEKVLTVLNLGDFVRGDYPDIIMDRIMADERFINIKGNHEDGYYNEIVMEITNGNKYTNWIESLENNRIFEIEGKRILMTHSRINSNHAAPLLYKGGTLDEFMEDYPNEVDLICFGHTHTQLYIENFYGKKILNPGSLGLAIDGLINFAIIEINGSDIIYKLYKI